MVYLHDNYADMSKVGRDVTDSCKVCKKLQRAPLTPVVAFSLASSFNEVVAMDIKHYNDTLILHLVDHATWYSSCKVLSVPNIRKKKRLLKQYQNIGLDFLVLPRTFSQITVENLQIKILLILRRSLILS